MFSLAQILIMSCAYGKENSYSIMLDVYELIH